MPSGEGDGSKKQDEKFDQILAQLATLYKRLDNHDLRIARTEKFHTGDDDESVDTGTPRWPPPLWRSSRTAGGYQEEREGERCMAPRFHKIDFPTSTVTKILSHG